MNEDVHVHFSKSRFKTIGDAKLTKDFRIWILNFIESLIIENYYYYYYCPLKSKKQYTYSH